MDGKKKGMNVKKMRTHNVTITNQYGINNCKRNREKFASSTRSIIRDWRETRRIHKHSMLYSFH